MQPKTDLSFLSYADRLTADQAYAGGSVTHSVAVTAGAGAGKTGVLVARFIALLHQGVQPEQIVAITFTRKAAAEMAERVQAELQRLARSEPRARSWLLELPQAQISTIHSLAARILRRFPLQAGIDPAFRMIEEYESASLLQQSCHDALEKWLLQREEIAQRLYPTFDSGKFIDSLYRIIMLLRNRGEDINALFSRAALVPPFQEKPQFRRYAEALAQYLPQVKGNATKVLASIERMINLCTELDSMSSFEPSEIIPADPLMSSSDGASSAAAEQQLLFQLTAEVSRVESEAAKEHKSYGLLRDYLNELTPRGSLLEHLSAYLDCLLHPDLLRILELLGEIQRRFSEAKEALGGLDYHDLEEKAVAVLRTPEAAEELRRDWRFFLVDEFQDVNLNQYRLVELLCDSRLNEALFVCGDPKQSIYRFRGAVVSLFDALSGRILQLVPPPARGEVSLSDNFRTLAPLLDFVNQVFTQLMPQRYSEMRANRSSLSKEPSLEILRVCGDKAEELRRNEARAIARRVYELVRGEEKSVQKVREQGEARCGADWGDIALLFRARADITVYEAALREIGVPTLQIGGRDFYTRPEILILRVLLQVLLRPDDQHALWQWLTGEFVGISPEKLSLGLLRGDAKHFSLSDVPLDAESEALRGEALRRIKRWRLWLNLLPLDELMERIVEELWLPEYFALDSQGEQRLANIHKMIAIARQLAEREARGPEGLLRLFDALEEGKTEGEQEIYAADGDGIPAVRLLTVHAAKGLEFPVVILPDLLRPGRRFAEDAVLLFGAPGLVLPHSAANAMAIREEEAQQDEAENLRLLYVALTRARDHLILCVPEETAKVRASSGSWWKLLQPVLAQLKPGSYRESGSGVGRPTSKMAEDIMTQTKDSVEHDERLKEEEITLRLAEQRLTPAVGSTVATTALLNYQRCKRLYYLQSRLHLTPPYAHRRGDLEYKVQEEARHFLTRGEEGSAADESDSLAGAVNSDEALRFGSLMHKLCEVLCTAAHSELNEGSLKQLIAERASAYAYAPREFPRLQSQIVPMLQRFMRSSLMHGLRAASRYYSELPFSYRLPSGIVLNGIIDLLVVNGDGTLSLYDYKTNRIRSRSHQHLAQRYGLQICLYAAAAEAYLSMPVREAQLYLFHAREGEELQPVIDRSEEQFSIPLLAHDVLLEPEEALRQADSFALELSTGWQARHFPLAPRGSGVCRNCGYASLCQRALRFKAKSPLLRP